MGKEDDHCQIQDEKAPGKKGSDKKVGNEDEIKQYAKEHTTVIEVIARERRQDNHHDNACAAGDSGDEEANLHPFTVKTGLGKKICDEEQRGDNSKTDIPGIMSDFGYHKAVKNAEHTVEKGPEQKRQTDL